MHSAPTKRAERRIYLVIVGSILVGVLFLLWPSHSGVLAPRWIAAGAAVGIVLTVAVGWWARKHSRYSLTLALLLAGNLICFVSVLARVGVGTQSMLLNAGFLFWGLSMLARFMKLFSKKR